MQKTLIIPQNREDELLLKFYFSLGKGDYNSCFSKHEFTNYQRFVLLINYIKENKPLREFVDWLKKKSTLPRFLQLKKIPSKSTLNSWFDMFDIELIKQKMRDFFKPKSQIFAVDGTGLETENKGNYIKKRFGLRTKSNFNKFDAIVDIESKIILDFEFHYKQRHDLFVFDILLQRLRFNFKFLLADKGYYSFKIFKILKNKSIFYIVPPKNYGNKCRGDNLIRKQFHKCYYENEALYPLRNIVECVFSALKRKEFRILKMKYRDIEISWKVLAYNLRKSLLHIFILLLDLIKIQNFNRNFMNYNY